MEQFPKDDANKDENMLVDDAVGNPSPEASAENLGDNSLLPLKQRLLEGLETVFLSTFNALGLDTGRDLDRDVKELDSGAESFEKLSEEAGVFFEGLIPKGIRGPNKKNVQSHSRFLSNSIAHESKYASQKLYGARSRWRKDYEEKKKAILEGTLFDERKPFEGEVVESKAEGSSGGIVQVFERAIVQSGGTNLIREKVRNYINEQRSYNSPSASLVLQDIKTGRALSLNSLLPYGFDFKPAFLTHRVGEISEQDTEGEGQKIEPRDLKGYPQNPGNRESFSAILSDNPFARGVIYSDLTEKGNVLSLLHEIAHSWQSEYLDHRGGGLAFKETYNGARKEFDLLFYASSKWGREDSHYQKIHSEALGKFKALGVEPYYDGLDKDFSTTSPVIEEGVINIVSLGGEIKREKEMSGKEIDALDPEIFPDVYYPVRSNKLQETLDDFIADERDAWAHALKTVRFLRTRGIDVEPELANLEEVKKVIDPCLGSYQNFLDMKIHESDRRFSKRPGQ